MFKSKIRAVVASMAVMAASGVVSADTVVGQVTANPSAMVSSGSASVQVGAERVAYIQGDVVATASESIATVDLTSGKASFIAAPNTTMQVMGSEVAIDNGAVEFTAAQGFPVSFTSAAGTFTVNSDVEMNAVAVVEAGKFVLASKSGSLTVSTQDGVVSQVEAGEAFAFNGEAQVVDVQLLSGGFLGLTGGAAVAAAAGAIVIAGVVVNEISDDDDDNASPR